MITPPAAQSHPVRSHASASRAAISLLRPAGQTSRWVFDVTAVLVGSLLIAASAQVAIPVGFSPVPITGQTFGVLVVAAMLGRGRGVAAVLAYLAEGAAGLPFFAAGTAGAGVLIGPTGGYLAGFIAAAWIVGSLADRGLDRSPLRAAIAMTIGTAAIFVFGLAWLVVFVPADVLLAVGFWPFVPGAIVKILAAAGVLPMACELTGAMRRRDG